MRVYHFSCFHAINCLDMCEFGVFTVERVLGERRERTTMSLRTVSPNISSTRCIAGRELQKAECEAFLFGGKRSRRTRASVAHSRRLWKRVNSAKISDCRHIPHFVCVKTITLQYTLTVPQPKADGNRGVRRIPVCDLGRHSVRWQAPI